MAERRTTVDTDHSLQQLLRARLENVGADPLAADWRPGLVWFHESDRVPRIFDGVNVRTFLLSPGGGEPVVDSVVSVTAPTATSVLIDARASQFDGNATGGTLGRHSYTLSAVRQVLDVTAGDSVEPTQGGANVTDDGSGEYTKSVSGNTWDAWFQSVDPIGAAISEDFAVSWLVESVDGTIREMGGLDNNPSENSSYTSGEYLIYQVNGNSLQFYEKTIRVGLITYQLQVGDRLGVKVIDGKVVFFHIRAGVETELFESPTPTSETLWFKGAINRGVGSSGHGSIGDVRKHIGTSPQSVTSRIEGLATEIVGENDIADFAKAGLLIDPASTYSLINASVEPDATFPAGALTHSYSVSTGQSIVDIP